MPSKRERQYGCLCSARRSEPRVNSFAALQCFDTQLRRSSSPSTHRNPFNPQSLISHLTNSNGCGNLQTKVPLTVSPFRPFLFPQPRVFSANHRFLSSLFSYSYKSLFPQSLYFHIHTKPPGCGDLGSLSRHSSLATRHFPFVLSNLPPLGLSCLSFSRSLRLFSTICGLFCKNAGVCGGHPERNYGTPRVGGRANIVLACRHTKQHGAALHALGDVYKSI
jgi:hypothetical protein